MDITKLEIKFIVSTLVMTDDELLNHLFYKKNIFSFKELYKKAKEAHPKITEKIVKEFHSKQQSIEMTNKPLSNKNEFLPIYSETPYAFQIDLTFFPRYKKQNYNHEVLFTAININTRYAYAYPCKSKEMIFILEALKKMEEKTIINSITCDKGSEFTNYEFKKFCKENEIILYFVTDSHKLGIINRFHRTLKEKLTQYFISQNTVNWYDIIDEIIYNYNHSYNRGIGNEPYKVNAFLEQRIIEKKKEKTQEILKDEIKINIGDFCRILAKKELFGDKLIPKYTDKIFEIIRVKNNSVIVKDDKDKQYKVKKTDIKIIKNKENNQLFTEQREVNKEYRDEKKLKKEDQIPENITREPRKGKGQNESLKKFENSEHSVIKKKK